PRFASAPADPERSRLETTEAASVRGGPAVSGKETKDHAYRELPDPRWSARGAYPGGDRSLRRHRARRRRARCTTRRPARVGGGATGTLFEVGRGLRRSADRAGRTRPRVPAGGAECPWPRAAARARRRRRRRVRRRLRSRVGPARGRALRGGGAEPPAV